MAEIRLKELYRSIQGEASFAGRPCVFVRTVGCDIRCRWCDEPHAFTGGERVSLERVIERVAALGVRLVEITGGEPLLQDSVPELIERLLDAGYEVLVETGGHRDISVLDPRCVAIVDVKCPGSGEVESNDFENLGRLRPRDELKFVLADRADYEWARDRVQREALAKGNPVYFSPVHGELDPALLSAWILEDGLEVRLNLQLHKYVWGDDASGV